MEIAELRGRVEAARSRGGRSLKMGLGQMAALLDVAEATKEYLAWEMGDGGDDEGERLYGRVKSTLNALAEA